MGKRLKLKKYYYEKDIILDNLCSINFFALFDQISYLLTLIIDHL